MAPPVQNNSPAAKPEPNLVAEFLGDFQDYCRSGEPLQHDTDEHGGTVEASLAAKCHEDLLRPGFYSGASYVDRRATFNVLTGGYFNATPENGIVSRVPSLKSFSTEKTSVDYRNTTPGQKEMIHFVATYLYVKTRNAHRLDREMIAAIISNRLHHPGFKGQQLKSPEDVIRISLDWNGQTQTSNDAAEWVHARNLATELVLQKHKPEDVEIVYFNVKPQGLTDEQMDAFAAKRAEAFSTPSFKAIHAYTADQYLYFVVEPAKSYTAPTPKAYAARPVEFINLDPKIHLIASVLYAEARGATSEDRRRLAAVMKNRVGHKGFNKGRLKTAYAVANATNPNGAHQFNCINDPKNNQWQKTRNPANMDDKDFTVWKECVGLAKQLMAGTFKPVNTKIVYYHDHSIAKPPSWDNPYWITYLVYETGFFIFYAASQTVASKTR